MAKYKPKNLFPEASDFKENKALSSKGSTKEAYKPKNLFPESEESRAEAQKLAGLQKTHPVLLKLAELLHGTPGLQQAGNVAGHFSHAVEGTGLPSAARGFLGTGVEAGRGLLNLLPGVNERKQQLPQLNVNPYVGEGAEIAGSFAMGAPIYKGYQGAKAGLEALPHAGKVPELIKSLLAGGATGAAISPDNRALGAALGGGAELAPTLAAGTKNLVNRYRIAPKERALQQAEQQLLGAEQDVEHLGRQASHEFSQKDPERLLLSAADKARELEAGQQYQRVHETPEMRQMRPGAQGLQETKGNLENINQQLRQVLGEGEPHTNQLSNAIVNAIEGVPVIEPHPETGLPRQVRQGGLREEIGKKYDALEEGLPEVEIPSIDTKQVDKTLKGYYGKKSNVSEKDKANFRTIVEQAHTTNKKISGKDFFRAYRSLRRIEGEERSKAFSGLSPKDHDAWIERANNTKQTYKQMEDIIDKHFPENTLKRLHEVNHEYANKVAPLHENPMYQQMLKHGRYEGDAIKALSGTTKGNDILRNMIQNNPALSRLVLGHSFAGSPENLLKPNQLIEPYQRANPEIAKLMQLQRQGHEAVQQAQADEPIIQQVMQNRQLRQDIDRMTTLAKEQKFATEVEGISKAEVAKRKKALELTQQRLANMKKLRKGLGWTALAGAIQTGSTYLGNKLAGK